MIKDVNLVLSPQEACDEKYIESRVASILNIRKERIKGIKYVRKSIDSRRIDIKINLLLRAFIDEDATNLWQEVTFPILDESSPIVVIVGSGPAGLFASLTLLEKGIRPIVLERGKDVHERKKDTAILSTKGILNENSNYSFGEGGAGAFSDGKLYTRSVKRGDVRKVLELFVQHGAQENILYESHPHIGTDRLPVVIENIRKRIIASGGEVHFNTTVTSLIKKGDKIIGVKTDSGEEFIAPVLLATGHSAKDVYRFLDKSKIKLQAKECALGVRVEHPQILIDRMQYHNKNGRGRYLPPATYSFVTQVEGRGVYSFCMCPGGSIVPASTENGMLVVNGMSAQSRSGKYANAAFVVQIRECDVPKRGIWGILDYIEDIERRSFRPYFKAPSSRLSDFVKGKGSSSLPYSTYRPGCVEANLFDFLPPLVSSSLKEGFLDFNRMTRGGFITDEAVVVASETRTSSPIRIVRNDRYAVQDNLYVSGEGAGYAGGIVSACIDGQESAKRIAEDIWGVI